MEKILREWLEEKEFIEDGFKLDHIRTGESNSVFRLNGERDLIVKVESEDGVSDRLAYEAKVMEFLKGRVEIADLILHEETDFGPVLIQEEIGEQDIEFTDMSPGQREKLMQLLAEVHSVDISGKEEFFGEDIEISTNTRDYFNWKIQGKKTQWDSYISEAERTDPNLESLYYRSLELMETAPEREIELCLCHSDFISNMRASGEKIYLVDWELAGLDLPEYSLVTQMRRGRLSKEEREKLLEEYWKFRDRREVYRELSEYLWTCFLLGDVLWAAETSASKEGEESERVGRKLRDRKRRLKHYLENGEILMEKMYSE